MLKMMLTIPTAAVSVGPAVISSAAARKGARTIVQPNGSRDGKGGAPNLEPQGVATVPATIYAVVQDVPASWGAYLEGCESIGDLVPEGLLVHVAGPTDEGFRVIDVWESQAAWERFRDDQLPGVLERLIPPQQSQTTFRDLIVRHLFLA